MAFFKKIFSILADSLAKTLGHGFDFQTCPKHANLRRSTFRKWMVQNSVVKIIRIQILVKKYEPPLTHKWKIKL